MTAVVPHPDTIRAPIELEFNALRDAIEQKFVSDHVALHKQYELDLKANNADKRAALLAAGLNPDGSTPAGYPGTIPVLPEDTAVPTISGTPTIDEELTADPGTWLNDPVFTYQWERADSDGSNNADIDGETESTYTLVEADVGKKVRVTVTGTLEDGTDVASSLYTAVIAPLAPENTVVPTITGTTTVGELLTAHNGTWTGDPEFTYQWGRVDSDGISNAANIGGATASTYTLVEADEGKKVRVVVTGTNDGGTDTGTSLYSATVAAAGP